MNNKNKKPKEDSEVSQIHTSQTAQPPNPAGLLKWKSIQDEKPNRFTYVNIWDGHEVLYNWVRVICENGDYYINDDMEMMKYNVTHWSYPHGYKPKKENDTKLFTVKDINQFIKTMKKLKIPYHAMSPWNTQRCEGINDGVSNCIKILQRKLIRTQKTQQLKLHTK